MLQLDAAYRQAKLQHPSINIQKWPTRAPAFGVQGSNAMTFGKSMQKGVDYLKGKHVGMSDEAAVTMMQERLNQRFTAKERGKGKVMDSFVAAIGGGNFTALD